MVDPNARGHTPGAASTDSLQEQYMPSTACERSALHQGDITTSPVGASVNAANSALALVWLSLLLSGCAATTPDWNTRTSRFDQLFALAGRGDRELVYREVGRPAAARTLIFVHGLGGSKADWGRVAPHFADDYGVVLVDLLGHGRSDAPTDAEYSVAAQAARLRMWLRARDYRDVVLVGSSYGGAIALELAREWSGTCAGERITGLVLVAPAALNFAPRAAVDAAWKRELLALLLDGRTTGRLLLEGAFHDPARIPPDVLDEYMARYAALSRRQRLARITSELFAGLSAREAAPERYAAVDWPVLLVWGAHDDVVPRDVLERLEAALPRGQTRMIAASGHVPHLERPQEFTTVVREYLRTLPPGRRDRD